jgi:putative DNA-invertase from lambdoid prophage Rac
VEGADGTETVSGSSAASQREGFQRLFDRLERGDVLVVCKLDRLGRDVVDVATTVDKLAAIGVKVPAFSSEAPT